MRNEINLLQRPAAPAAPVLSLKLVALAPLAGIALVAAASAALVLQERGLEQEVAGLEAQARLRDSGDAARGADLAALEQTLAVHSATLTTLRASGIDDRSGFAGTFRALARATIDGAWLTGASVEHGAATLHGRALGPARVSAYLDSLHDQPEFAGRSFQALEVTRAKDPRDGTASVPPAWLDFTLVNRPATGALAVTAASATAGATEGKVSP